MEQRRKHPHQHNHMGRGLIPLLLALVLCIGLCVPALAKVPETPEEWSNSITITRKVTWHGKEYQYNELDLPIVTSPRWKATLADEEAVKEIEANHGFFGEVSGQTVEANIYGVTDCLAITNTGDNDFNIIVQLRVYRNIGGNSLQKYYVYDGTPVSSALLCDDGLFRSDESLSQTDRSVTQIKSGETVEIKLDEVFREYYSREMRELLSVAYLYELNFLPYNVLTGDFEGIAFVRPYVFDANGENTALASLIPDDGNFTDVSNLAYYYDAVYWALEKGITNGTTATKFSPNYTCTRAQILTFIWRYSGEPEPNISNPFTDVTESAYFYKAALWAYEKGMVTGTEFAGDTPCTRAAAVTYLWILAGQPDYSSIINEMGTTFSDVPADAEYVQAVMYAKFTGITTGSGTGYQNVGTEDLPYYVLSSTFTPDGICSRAHIVTFLKRYDDNVASKN